jgi:hypothetical protein
VGGDPAAADFLAECLPYKGNSWIPATGRYFFTPVLPALTPEVALKRFERAIPFGKLMYYFTPVAARNALFDATYPLEATGTSWSCRIGQRWLVANPHENEDKLSEFAIPLEDGALTLNGVFPPHTFAIVERRDDVLLVWLNNYRSDKSRLWERSDLQMDGDMSYIKYLQEEYIPHPQDGVLRCVLLALRGCVSRPEFVLSGSHMSEKASSWNSETGEWTLEVRCNGLVEIAITVPTALHSELVSSVLPE